MRNDIKAAIEQFFPGSSYVNPVERSVSFSFDHRKLIYDVIGQIRHRVGRKILHSSDGQYDLSENIVIRDHIILRMSFLGPFAHVNLTTAKRHMAEDEIDLILKEVKQVLNLFEIILLPEDDVLEEVGWLHRGDSLVGDKVRVWNCLFCEY